MASQKDLEKLREYEIGFRKAGLPLFSEDVSAWEDIFNRAAPLLRAAVIKAQSAQVQTISGATVTSDAYLTSLQAALDAANL